jgi:putative transposase
MLRQPRIDIPGLLQHVIVRGIERTEIFCDDEDRHNFVARFNQLLVDTGTDCYAWALIPNHCHFLLRCHSTGLPRFMRRLLTGHAGYFNRRYLRSGHLFQNRYKSIICEEEPYFLELIRYIHLNPLRAGLISQFEELGGFPWSGHSVIMGKQKLEGQSTDTVLGLFGKRLKTARANYRQFIADGLAMGNRPELVGGGLCRSQKESLVSGNIESFDARILGSGDFVDELQGETPLVTGRDNRMSLDGLQEQIVALYDLTKEQLKRRGRENLVSDARALFSYLAVTELQITCVEVGQFLDVGSSSVSRAVRRGEELFLTKSPLQTWWKALKQ